jgi:acetyl esterase/lipase
MDERRAVESQPLEPFMPENPRSEEAAADEASPGRTATRRWVYSLVRFLWFVAVAAALALAVAVTALELGAIVPGLGLFSAIGSFVMPVLAPLLVIAALPAIGLGLARRRRSPRRTATAAAAAGIAGAVTGIAIIAIMISAVGAAGGSVNIFRALAPSSVTAASPDASAVYHTVDGQALSVAIYRPSGPPRAWPVLFYIHGGGWNGGSNDTARTDYRWYANHGWLVISAQYRLATATDHTWNQAPGDVACALAWTARNATQLGADLNRLVLAGDSAGGNLAINLGYSAAARTARSNCGGTVPVPAAVVATYPAVNPVSVYDDTFTFGSVSGSAALAEYAGGTPQQYPGRYKAISSSTYITGKAPQTLIIEPEHDSRVPPGGVYAFVGQARAAGVDITLAAIPFANHAFNFYAAGTIGDQACLTITQNYLAHRILA